MATQQQAQQPQKPERRKGFPLGQLIIIIIFILTIIAYCIAAYLILRNQGITQGSTTLTIVSIIFGLIVGLLALMFAIFQWRYPVTPNTPKSGVTSPPPAIPSSSFFGIIGLPPPTDPRIIQQRENDVKAVYNQLTQPSITAIALTGISGIGKSTLAALIYRYAENQRHNGSVPFTAESLWLTINPAVTMTDLVGTLIETLGKPMLDLATLSPQNQAAALFNALNTVDKPSLIILDQFENLLDRQTGQALPDRVGVGEWLDALNSQPCRCRVLLTSRPDPQGTREYPPTYLQTYHVEGLEEAEGIELLRKQSVAGTETELRTAVARCDGHAYALILLASLLRTRKLSLTTLLKDPAYDQLWTGKVAENILNSIYRQLDELQRKLLVAFSVFREPVPLEAAQAIIDENAKISKVQVESALEALLAQHLLQASGEARYQLHVIVADYARDHVVEDNVQANPQTLHTVHARAAHFYQHQAATSCPPREQRRQTSDVHDLIEAIWQYCKAEQWQEAYNLMEQQSIFADLNRWGGNTILLELYQLLLPDKRYPKPSQAALIYNNLCEVYYALSKFREALPYYEQSQRIYKEAGDRKGEGEELNNLGSLYDSLGNTEQALSYYQQALDISREVGDRRGEGITLWNIGALYFEQSRYDVSLACFLLARSIFEEVQSPNRDKVQGWIDDLQEKVGKKQFDSLLSQVEPQAHQIVERTLHEGLRQV
jgi:tetratricopeptide (TPR) repeat protein